MFFLLKYMLLYFRDWKTGLGYNRPLCILVVVFQRLGEEFECGHPCIYMLYFRDWERSLGCNRPLRVYMLLCFRDWGRGLGCGLPPCPTCSVATTWAQGGVDGPSCGPPAPSPASCNSTGTVRGGCTPPP